MSVEIIYLIEKVNVFSQNFKFRILDLKDALFDANSYLLSFWFYLPELQWMSQSELDFHGQVYFSRYLDVLDENIIFQKFSPFVAIMSSSTHDPPPFLLFWATIQKCL